MLRSCQASFSLTPSIKADLNDASSVYEAVKGSHVVFAMTNCKVKRSHKPFYTFTDMESLGV